MADHFLRLLASWALLHELADEAWKAAVARGRGAEGEDAIEGDPHLDALAALVAEEKDRLREALASGELTGSRRTHGQSFEEIRFEIGEIRSRLETMESTLDALSRKLDAR